MSLEFRVMSHVNFKNQEPKTKFKKIKRENQFWFSKLRFEILLVLEIWSR